MSLIKLDPAVLPLIDLLGKGSALLLLAFTCQCIWQRAAAAHRSLIWLSAFAVLLMLPATLLVKPRWEVTVAAPVNAPLPAVVPALPQGPVMSGQQLKVQAPSWWSTITLWQAGGLTWAAGCLMVLGFRVLGGWQLRRLRQASDSVSDARIWHNVQRLAEESGIKRHLEIRQSFSIGVPLTWGWLKPVLLLPADASSWDNEQLDAALRHELGHVRHFDACTRLLATLVCALWWPAPWVWMAAKAWRLEQEKACDDLVLRAGASAEVYAMQLLHAARVLSTGTSAAMAMARASTLETRLRAVMDGRRNRGLMSRGAWMVSGGCAVLFGCLCLLAQLRATEPGEKLDSAVISTTIYEAPAGTLKALASNESDQLLEPDAAKQLEQKLKAEPKVKRLARPTLFAQSGQKASFEVKTYSPYGFLLELVPRVRTASTRLDASLRTWTSKDTPRAEPDAKVVELKFSAEPAAGQTMVMTGSHPLDAKHELICLITPRAIHQTPSPMKAKANSLRLPIVAFNNAKIEEALDYLRVKAREVDPKKEGFNIVLVDKPPPATRITVDLKQIPLSDALHYVAELAGLQLSFGPSGAVIQKPAPPKPLKAALTEAAALQQVTSLLPAQGMHLTTLNIKNGHIVIVGEISDQALAGALRLALKRAPTFVGFRWDFPPPHDMADGRVLFRAEGIPPAGDGQWTSPFSS